MHYQQARFYKKRDTQALNKNNATTTLLNETVWERTHRLAGILFVLGGLLGIVVSFIPFIRLYGVIVIMLLASFIPAIYSYVVYQRIVVHGKQKLSPPFDGGEEA